ncbi:MAG: hypothetical protein IIB64_05810 [Proteobacteria bacterium]|nr:hypothetical protein [Pseudomonadota bacterium]
MGSDDKLQEKLISDFFNQKSTLGTEGQDFLKGIDGIKDLLENELQQILETLRKDFEGLGLSEEEIAARLQFVEDTGNKRIDDLIEDFTDEIEEAIEALSKAVSEAFVEMALKGEFSAKKIGDAFLKTFLDIVSKELIQKPLEQLLGSLFSALFGTNLASGGSAAGGAVAAGVPTFINEQGQEIFIPHTPGRILNAPDSQRLLGGGSQVIINQNLKFDTAIKNDMMATIFQASPLLVEHTKQAVLQTLQGRRIN